MENNTTCITATGANKRLEYVNIYILLLQGAAVTMIEALGLVMNIFVMIVILANKELRTRPFLLSLQIIVMNVFFISLLYTPIALTGLYREWLFGEVFCKTVGATALFIGTWRWPVMFLLVLDRFLTIFCPFSYHGTRAKCVTIILSIVILSACILTSVIPLFDIGIGCYVFTELALMCVVSWQCTSIICHVYYYFITITFFVFGGIVPVALYIAMYIKGRRLRKLISPVITNDNDRNTSPVSEMAQRSEKRARITVLIMFINLICLSLPAFVSWAIHQTISDKIAVEYKAGVQYVMSDIYYCLPIADAVVILQNKDIKSAVRKMMVTKNLHHVPN